jgi:hypothetical protein
MKHVGKFIGWLVIGFIVLAVGIALAVGNIPRTGDLGESTGNTGAMIFGLLIAAIGQLTVLICTIALGVFLGTREAHFEQQGV